MIANSNENADVCDVDHCNDNVDDSNDVQYVDNDYGNGINYFEQSNKRSSFQIRDNNYSLNSSISNTQNKFKSIEVLNNNLSNEINTLIKTKKSGSSR